MLADHLALASLARLHVEVLLHCKMVPYSEADTQLRWVSCDYDTLEEEGALAWSAIEWVVVVVVAVFCLSTLMDAYVQRHAQRVVVGDDPSAHYEEEEEEEVLDPSVAEPQQEEDQQACYLCHGWAVRVDKYLGDTCTCLDLHIPRCIFPSTDPPELPLNDY